jgi:hypothetical protein
MDFSQDLELFAALLQRECDAEIATAEEKVVSTAHSRGNFDLRHPIPFRSELERGARRFEIVPGPPAAPRDVIILGLDSAKRVTLARRLNADGEVTEVTAARHEADMTTAVSFPVMRARYELWDGERIIRAAHSFAGSIERTDYLYEQDMLVEIVETRFEPRDSEQWVRRNVINRDSDGQPLSIISEGEVRWRSRSSQRGSRKLLHLAEDALYAAVQDGLARLDAAPDLLLFRHQSDGGWTDQALPTVSATTLGDIRDTKKDVWDPSDWPAQDVVNADAVLAVLAALETLDSLGDPEPSASRRLLRSVAWRVSSSSDLRTIAVVSGFDPDDLFGDIESSTTRQQRERLARLGWLQLDAE